jgi:hypothetical protein
MKLRRAGGKETTPDEVLADLDASLHHAHQALAGLLDMLGGCAPDHPVRAGALRMLLLPVADQLAQAALTARAL